MKKRYSLILAAAVLMLSACEKEPVQVQTTEAVTEAVPAQALRITAQPDEESCQRFSSQELSGNFSNGLNIKYLKNVEITVDGQSLPLEEALKLGKISEEEICFSAREDARNGFCKETFESVHGVASFTYEYPEYHLLLIHDVYETPDGKQHLINEMTVYSPRSSDGYTSHQEGPYWHFLNDEGYIMDKEDWGLTFYAKEISPTGLVLESTQANGQQTGQLVIFEYVIRDGERPLDFLDSSAQLRSFELSVTQNGSEEYILDWTDVYGPLSAGEYTLSLGVADRFDAATAPPLIQNFTDHHWFDVSITIP